MTKQNTESKSKEVAPEVLERRRILDRARQRRCYERRVERKHGKPFEECDRRRGPRPSNRTETYAQRRATAHRLAYEEHKRECRKIDCSICSIVFAPKKSKNDDEEPTCDEAAVTAPAK